MRKVDSAMNHFEIESSTGYLPPALKQAPREAAGKFANSHRFARANIAILTTTVYLSVHLNVMFQTPRGKVFLLN